MNAGNGLCILWKRVIKPGKRLRSLGFSPKSLDKELDSKGWGVKPQEKAGTLPLAISMMKRIIAPQTQSLNMLEELQGLDEERGDHLVTGTSVENYRVVFSKGEVVALKHNYRTHLEPFFLAILWEDLHSRNDCFWEEKLKINWLEQSEEDPLVYNEGNFDDQNSPKCIMDRVSVDREAEQFILRRNEFG